MSLHNKITGVHIIGQTHDARMCQILTSGITINTKHTKLFFTLMLSVTSYHIFLSCVNSLQVGLNLRKYYIVTVCSTSGTLAQNRSSTLSQLSWWTPSERTGHWSIYWIMQNIKLDSRISEGNALFEVEYPVFFGLCTFLDYVRLLKKQNNSYYE